MAVQCSNCGEELLGAVNRCWKCGSAFAAPPTSSEAPPVRRAPVSLVNQPVWHTPVAATGAAPLSAEIVAETILAESVGGPSCTTRVAAAPAPVPTRRRGSPFADSHTARNGQAAPAMLVQPAVIQPARGYRPPVNDAFHSAATGGAVASLLLGVLGLCGSYYIPAGALITAVLGIGMGLWGIYSERRGLAIAGLLFCCITLAVAGFFGAIELFTYINGYRPWEVNPELQTGPISDF